MYRKSPTPKQATPTRKTKVTKPQAKQTHPNVLLQRAIKDPTTLNHTELLTLQSAVGNRVMRSILTQSKPKTNSPISPQSEQQNTIQRQIKGTLGRVKLLGGNVSWSANNWFRDKAGKEKSTYAQILERLDAYEKAEGGSGAMDKSELSAIYNLAQGWLLDSKHSDSIENEQASAVGRGRAMSYLMSQIAQEMGWTQVVEDSPRNVVEVYMGQGVVGDLTTHTFTSEDFSTCSPIVMYNSKTNMGGLYHFPAGRIKEYASQDWTGNKKELGKKDKAFRGHWGYVITMLEAVQPTNIWIYQGSSRRDDGTGTDGFMHDIMDRESSVLMESMKELQPNASVQKDGPFGAINIKVEDNKLVRTEARAKGKKDKANELEARMLSMMPSSRRKKKKPKAPPIQYYDLAKDAPPKTVLFFGHITAGTEWQHDMKGIDHQGWDESSLHRG